MDEEIRKQTDVVIRKIEERDYQSVAEIWRNVLDIPVGDAELADTYGKMKEDDRYSTFVAEADGKVVGLVTMVKVLAIGHPSGYTKVNGLGVLQEYRNMGIGNMLIQKAEEEAVSNGTRYLGLASGFKRDDAHRFYEHLGFVKTSYWFRKRV